MSTFTFSMLSFRLIKYSHSVVTFTRGMCEGSTKKQRLMAKIGTHNGTFHCDEALACYLLRRLPEYKDALILRSRDPAVLDTCDVVVDVGGVYEPSNHRYDHHQRSFSHSMNSLNSKYKWVTKLSSAGLVYFHFGHHIIAEILKTEATSNLTSVIYHKVYEMFVEEIDGIDNGIERTDEKPRYAITTNLSSRVGHLNPKWNESASDDEMMVRFHKAMALTGLEFTDRVQYFGDTWWPARKLVQEAVNKRSEVDTSEEVILFSQGGVPWKDHLFVIEEEENIEPSIKFVLYTDQNGKWRIQCVPVSLHSFENRLSLPKEWCGVRNEELSVLTGIPGCIFVHANGFIGGNETYEGIIEMARTALKTKPTL